MAIEPALSAWKVVPWGSHVLVLVVLDGPPAADGWALASWCRRACMGLVMLISPAHSALAGRGRLLAACRGV